MAKTKKSGFTIGVVGVGRMGANIVRRLMKNGGHQAVVYDKSQKAVAELAKP